MKYFLTYFALSVFNNIHNSLKQFLVKYISKTGFLLVYYLDLYIIYSSFSLKLSIKDVFKCFLL